MDYKTETASSSRSTLNNNNNKLAKARIKTLVLPTETVQNIHYKLPVQTFATVTVSLPLWSLAFCFVTACIFQHDLVTETECHVSERNTW